MKISDLPDPDYSFLKKRIHGLRKAVLEGRAKPGVVVFTLTNHPDGERSYSYCSGCGNIWLTEVRHRCGPAAKHRPAGII